MVVMACDGDEGGECEGGVYGADGGGGGVMTVRAMAMAMLMVVLMLMVPKTVPVLLSGLLCATSQNVSNCENY